MSSSHYIVMAALKALLRDLKVELWFFYLREHSTQTTIQKGQFMYVNFHRSPFCRVFPCSHTFNDVQLQLQFTFYSSMSNKLHQFCAFPVEPLEKYNLCLQFYSFHHTLSQLQAKAHTYWQFSRNLQLRIRSIISVAQKKAFYVPINVQKFIAWTQMDFTLSPCKSVGK